MTSATNNENIESWLELESDPGLFTLLIEDFGVKGVQVEEIYDLSKNLDNSIFGFIFLFKWMERKNKRSKASALDSNSFYVTDPNIVNNMFFAHQIVPNSCATHALLSILLNSKENKYFNLGEVLTKFQKLCNGLSPEHKGYAIGNQPKLAYAHNSYAKPENSSLRNNQINDSPYAGTSSIPSSSVSTFSSSCSTNYSLNSSIDVSSSGAEIFHFICFVPINGRLYELDGLKPYPVDHGPLDIEQNGTAHTHNDCANWTNKFKPIIRHRLSSFNSGHQNHEIRFNLMALVPDKMIQISNQIDLLKHNYNIVSNVLNEYQNTCFNETDLNVRSKVKSEAINCIKKESEFEFNRAKQNEASNLITCEKKSNTRQLRSSRLIQNSTKSESITQKVTKNDQFEISLNPANDTDIKKDFFELCRIYRIISIKYLASSRQKFSPTEMDFKEKENEMELPLSDLKANLHSRIDTKQDEMSIKKLTDLITLKSVESKLTNELESEETKYNEEEDKKNKYREDALRRKHIYDEFIITYLKMLNESGKLSELVRSNGSNGVNNQFLLNDSQNSIHIQQNSTTKKRRK